MRQTTETKTSRKKPLLDQLLGKDTVVEERKVTTTTIMPDGSKKIETHTETKKIDKTPKKVTKTHVRESGPSYSSKPAPSSYSSKPAPSTYSSSLSPSSSSAKMFCSACGRAAKPNAKFCEDCGKPVVAKTTAATSSSASNCDSCGTRLKPNGKFW